MSPSLTDRAEQGGQRGVAAHGPEAVRRGRGDRWGLLRGVVRWTLKHLLPWRSGGLELLKGQLQSLLPMALLLTAQVQVVELKVTWITKSFCPGGTDSVSPPPSVITQENLGR